MRYNQIYEDRSLAPKTAYQTLIDDYIMFTTLNLAHLEKGAKDKASTDELIKTIQKLGEPSFNGKRLGEIPLNVIEKTENKIRILHFIHDMLKYALPRFKMYLTAAEYDKRKDRIKKLLSNYENAVKETT
jgi:hypothetical protein